MTTSPPSDPEGPAVAPAVAAPTVPQRPPSWRKRHPVLARTLLYGGMLAVLCGGALVGKSLLEESRQNGLVTRIQGAEQIRGADPERSLRILREDVLAKEPNADVRRRARLAEAATLDALRRYDDADRAYAAIESDWPAGMPKGPLYVPWANQRISAGRAAEGLALLDAPGATEGWPPEGVAEVRARGAAELASPKVRAPAPGPSPAGMSGGG